MNIGSFKENLCYPGIALVCLRAIADMEVGRYYDLDIIYHPGSKEGHTKPLPECSVVASFNFIVTINEV